MSTCPRCRQYLGDDHRCPRWVRWRRPMVRAFLTLLGAIVGAIAGVFVNPPFDLILIAAGGFAGYKLAPRRRRSRA